MKRVRQLLTKKGTLERSTDGTERYTFMNDAPEKATTFIRFYLEGLLIIFNRVKGYILKIMRYNLEKRMEHIIAAAFDATIARIAPKIKTENNFWYVRYDTPSFDSILG